MSVRQQGPPSEKPANVLSGGKLLWVDDNPGNNTGLADRFRASGMTVDVAVDTAEAVVRLREHRYQIIISAINRDGDDTAGISMLRQLERHGIDTPVVFYTGSFDYSQGLDRRASGAATNSEGIIRYVTDLMEQSRSGKS